MQHRPLLYTLIFHAILIVGVLYFYYQSQQKNSVNSASKNSHVITDDLKNSQSDNKDNSLVTQSVTIIKTKPLPQPDKDNNGTGNLSTDISKDEANKVADPSHTDDRSNKVIASSKHPLQHVQQTNEQNKTQTKSTASTSQPVDELNAAKKIPSTQLPAKGLNNENKLETNDTQTINSNMASEAQPLSNYNNAGLLARDLPSNQVAISNAENQSSNLVQQTNDLTNELSAHIAEVKRNNERKIKQDQYQQDYANAIDSVATQTIEAPESVAPKNIETIQSDKDEAEENKIPIDINPPKN